MARAAGAKSHGPGSGVAGWMVLSCQWSGQRFRWGRWREWRGQGRDMKRYAVPPWGYSTESYV